MDNNFTYFNLNPYKLEEEDCVTRAIADGLDLDYNVARNLLQLSAKANNCDMLCLSCYRLLLEDVFLLPVRYCENWETVDDIAHMFPNNRVIIRVDGHLTRSVYGGIDDLWDCRQRLVDCYWIAG